MRRTGKILALFLAPSLALGQADYGREKRWADQVVPAIVVGDAVQLELQSGRKFLAIYAEDRRLSKAVILLHGSGVHPDWGLVNVLRSELYELGLTTLSVQMPVLAADATVDRYPPLYPEAAQRVAAAVRYLRAKGHGKVAIVSHSLGSRMANYYLTHTNDPAISAWVSIGLTGAYTGGESLTVPILDLYGARDLPGVVESAPARADALRRVRGSAQVEVPNADHFFGGHEAALVRHVKLFLEQKIK